MAKRQCEAISKRGVQCRAAPLTTGSFCLAHSDRETQESTGFGGSQPNAGRPRIPRVTEVMREWVEEHALEVLQPYLDALGATLVEAVHVGEGESLRVETSYPDHELRMKAADKLQDRAVGRPRQRVEHQGGEDNEPIAVEFQLDEQAREAIAGVLRRRPAAGS